MVLSREDGGGGDEAGALILNQYGGPKAYSRSAYPQPWGFQVRGLSLKKTEARTRPERLSATETGVPGAWSQPDEDRGRDKAEEDGGGDKVGA